MTTWRYRYPCTQKWTYAGRLKFFFSFLLSWYQGLKPLTVAWPSPEIQAHRQRLTSGWQCRAASQIMCAPSVCIIMWRYQQVKLGSEMYKPSGWQGKYVSENKSCPISNLCQRTHKVRQACEQILDSLHQSHILIFSRSSENPPQRGMQESKEGQQSRWIERGAAGEQTASGHNKVTEQLKLFSRKEEFLLLLCFNGVWIKSTFTFLIGFCRCFVFQIEHLCLQQ